MGLASARALGVDMVWFGIVMALNLQTAFMSPPLGFSLFYMQSVAPKEVSTLDIHRSALPFLVVQLLVLLVVVIALPNETVRMWVNLVYSSRTIR